MRHNTTAPKLILLSQMLLINSLAVKMMVNESKFTSIKMNKRKSFVALLHRCYLEPSIFFMKGAVTLKKAATEPLYKESKGWTKEFTTLRFVLQLLMPKA